MAVYSYARNLLNDNYSDMNFTSVISYIDHVHESVDLMIDARFALFESSLDESYVTCLSEDAEDSIMTHVKAIGEKVVKFISSVLHFIMDKLQDILTAIIPRPENIGKKAPTYEYHDLTKSQVERLQNEGFQVTFVNNITNVSQATAASSNVSSTNNDSESKKEEPKKSEKPEKGDSGEKKTVEKKKTDSASKSTSTDSGKDTDKDKEKGKEKESDPKAETRKRRTKSNTEGGEEGKYYVKPLKYDLDKKFSVQVEDTYKLPEFSKLEEICMYPTTIVPLLDLREDMNVIYDRLKQLSTRETGKRETNRIDRWKEDRGANKTSRGNRKEMDEQLKEYKSTLDKVPQYFESQGFSKMKEVTVTDSDFKNMLKIKDADVIRLKNKILNQINKYQSDYNKYSNSCTKQLDTLVHSSDKAVAKSAKNLNKYYTEISKLVVDTVKYSSNAIGNYVGSFGKQKTIAEAAALADPNNVVGGGDKKDKEDAA